MQEEKDEIYKELTEFADANYIPVLLPETASVLKQIIMLAKPKKILEIGTAIGYSSLIMLRNSNAKLYTVELLEDRVEKAKNFFLMCIKQNQQDYLSKFYLSKTKHEMSNKLTYKEN